jgi:hypothetical protein
MKKILLVLSRALRLTCSDFSRCPDATPDDSQTIGEAASCNSEGATHKPDAIAAAPKLLPMDINPVVVKLPGAAYRLRYDRVGNIIHASNTD